MTNGWFTNAMPDLNQENSLVSRYLIQNALWWIETAGIDGIRLDTFPYVSRTFWHDFHAQVHSVFPRVTTVGEIFNGDPELTSYFAGGREHNGIDTGLDTPFDFPVYFAIRNVLLHDKPMTDLAKVLGQDALYPHPERLASFIGNHDTKRFLTEAEGSVARLKLALGLLLTLRGMPQIYAGDEIGMIGGNDPDNRHDFPGGFASDAQNAFGKEDRTATEAEVFAWTAGLIALRARRGEVQTGMEQNLLADEDAFAFVRAAGEAGCSSDHSSLRTLVVVNKALQSKTIDLNMEQTALAGCTVFDVAAPTAGGQPKITGTTLHMEEPADSMTVFEVR